MRVRRAAANAAPRSRVDLLCLISTQHQKKKKAYAGAYALIAETLRDLHSRVDLIHISWRGTTEEQKAQYGWCVALGVLAHDIATSIVVLLDADRLRAAKMLGRSMLEYYLRLLIYQAAPSEALLDATDAPKELRRFLESKPESEVSKLDISPEAIAQLEAFIEENKGKPRRRNVWKDLKTVNSEDHAQAAFEHLTFTDIQVRLFMAAGSYLRTLSRGRMRQRLS